MHKILPINIFLVIVSTFITMSAARAQENLTAEELFAKARHTAFNDKNFAEAISLTNKALIKSPDDTDLQIFLGRLYSWDNQAENSRNVFEKIIKEHPENDEVYLAYGNLEYWNKNYNKALEITEMGLTKNPGSQELMLLKAKNLIELKEFYEANTTINALLIINPKHEEARALNQGIAILSSKNAVGLRYDYSYFDKRFDDPWHLVALDYTRQTKFGSATARVNYANRFATDAAQFEVDLYPYFSKTFYAYVNTGISGNKDIFPQFRAGFSLYANLPAAFEVDAGFRFLNFTTGDTWVYTASVGKYYKNYWFNFRTYLTPASNNVSQAYHLNVRYYLGGANDYLAFRIGTGISPDNQTNNVFYNSTNYKLKSNNIALEYRRTIKNNVVVFAQASLENQEYAKDTRGNQISFGMGGY